jgi:Domain of unknown function (DUF4266)
MFRIAVCAFAAILLLAGCAGPQPVAAWEKGNLAKPIMAFDPDPLSARIRQQVYASKEAASGGAAVGSNNCGCN